MKNPFRFLCLLVLMMLAAVNTPAQGQTADNAGKEAAREAGIQQNPVLIPMPQQMKPQEGVLKLRPDRFICIQHEDPATMLRTGKVIQAALATVGQRLELTAAPGNDPACLAVIVSIAPELPHGAESYRLTIGEERIEIQAQSPTGAFRAALTLKQIARQRAGMGTLPCLSIEDWPDIPNRGIMVDISRDKVPRMETLYKLVDMMAEFKLNQLQLYTEHTFAYRNHKDVWVAASPMTSEEILSLDDYCRERLIELVPNQASFGHMNRWLTLPRYNALAESPDNPLTFCPTNPDAIKLLDEMYAELLPNFTSRQFNVGCDETWDLGKGRSKKFVQSEKDIGRLYLDFLLKIHALVEKNGRTMQFWADIILRQPELIPELPKDIIALAWGYEADSPYAVECEKFAKAGIPFYVCPGTSSWGSILGRTDNMKNNLWNAAENGKKFGALGFLITSWGDGGHFDHLPVAYAGYTYGAALSWARQTNQDIDLARALDVHVFQDKAGVMGKLVLDLGNTYLQPEVTPENYSVLWWILYYSDTPRSKEPFLKQVRLEPMQRTLAYLDKVIADLPKVKMDNPEAKQIAAEFRNNVALARHACRLDIARMQAGGEIGPAKLPSQTRLDLAADLRKIISDFKELWLVRNRKGGLEDSAGRMGNSLLKAYDAK
jgi:hypothetical protein